MNFDFSLIYDNYDAIIVGIGITLLVTIIAFIFALMLGVVIGVLRSNDGFIESFLRVYVSFFRGTPLLIQLFIIYYGLPSIGVNMGRYPAAIIALGLNSAAYISEIIRGSLKSVGKGQTDAASMIGLNRAETVFFIVLPQALRVSLPALVNTFTLILKDSSLISVLSIMELTRVGQLIYTRTYKPLEVYIIVALIYYMLVMSVVFISKRLENRINF
ncbi:amino acid ABC transporter permease [Brenneria populi subsp. brevivirga]|uniref:amino acid ABC transporter permease n=1 Tax=Brenneria populi TaxID=1505588 RepID=UPI002E178D7B|nr:amino acid ABC transporter permease [Brenneria populi subsp. brevivirga]